MKNILRKNYKILRLNILDKSIKDDSICENIINSSLYQNSKHILCYYPLSSEINILKIINHALSHGKKVSLPVSLIDGTMNFYYIDNLMSLKEGLYGIMEPPKSESNLVKDFSDSICLVPGLTFDTSGYRLGYGKGYYDRFLNRNNIHSIGLCYEELLVSILPINEFDQQVKFICTEKNIYEMP